MREPKKETSRNMFSKGWEEILNQRACQRSLEITKPLKKLEDKYAKIPKWVDVRPPQPSYNDVRMRRRTKNA